MPAIWEDDNGAIHYYIPPRPPPQPPAQTPQFKQAVNTAGAATTAYQKDPNDANTTALNNDWNTVQEMIAEQYRLALSSSDPAQQIAALNQQYGDVFRGSKGAAADIYNKYVLPGAQKEANAETPGERNAEIDLYNGLNEPDSSPTKGYDVAQADINVHLQTLYGNGTDGVYTAAQYKAAEAAADGDFDSKFAPIIKDVGTIMQRGPDGRNAEIQLYNGLNEPDSSPTKGYDVAKADINVHLQILYGNGTDGVYTADQYKAAEAAAAKDFAPAFSPVITGVGTSMQQGESYDTLLKVLQTEGPQVNPTNIGNDTTLTPAQVQSLEKTGLKLTPAQVTALGDLLTPEEKNSRTLILTPGQAQLAKIDPVTLSLLMTAGIKVPELSPQMLEIAKTSPSTFFYMEANGIDISVGTASSHPPAGVAQFNLGNGKQLNITINGKPLTTAQLPPGQGGTGRPSTGQTPSTVLGVYLGSDAASKGSGVVVPGSVAVANLLLGDPNLDLQVTPKTLSNPTTPQARNLTFLVSQADSARPDYINSTLSSLLAAAPPPNSKGATAYFTNVINPFLTTQSNGFFSSDNLVNFWNSSPVIDSAGTGSNPKTSIHSYLQNWLGTLPDNPRDQRQLLIAGGHLRQILTGAPPGLAKMLIPMVESQVNKISPQNQSAAVADLFDGLAKAVQIADQFPAASTAKNPPQNAAATQVADWLDSLGHHESFYSLGVGDRLYSDTAMYGYTDLANALMSYWPTGILATDIRNGEHDYNSTLQKQMGTDNYNAFENNKAQVLNGFFGQYSNTPGIGKPISVSNTDAVKKAIIAAYGFTPQDLAPVVTHNGIQTVTTPSQATNIVNTDLSWIQNQSIPGSTVTILPFMFASAGIANGTEGGVFFDVWNPPHKETRQRYEGRAGTQSEQVDVGPSHVLIDGSAAVDALQMDPNVWQHPESSDVKWHYSSYRDFQLSNTDYQNGTIYTLRGNQLGIGPDGAASSATDFHKEFDTVVGDIVGASQVVGLVLAPFTGGVSLAITGSLGLAWGTYQGIEGYDDAKSHGENFSLSNPNTRWEAISDITVAAGWATLGVAGTEASLARDATGAAETLTTATDEAGTVTTAADVAGTVTTAADGAGTVTTAADQVGTLDGVAEPGLTTAPTTVAAGTSNTVKALGVTKKVLEYGNYGLATAQTGKQIQSFSANYNDMSFWQQVNALAGIFEATVPFAAEPMNRTWFGENWSRPGRQQQPSDTESRQQPPDTVLPTDVTSESDSGLDGRPQTAAAILPDPTGSGKPVVPVTLTSDDQVVPVGKSPLIVVGSDEPRVTTPAPALTKPLTGFDPLVFTPDVQDELATLLSTGTIGSFNYDGKFRLWLKEVRATAAQDKARRAQELSLGAAGNPYLTPRSGPPTEEDIRTVSAILSQAPDPPAPVDPQIAADAVSRYFARTGDPSAGSTATPGEGSNTVPGAEAVPPPASSGDSSPPNTTLAGYYSTSNPSPRIVIIGGGHVGKTLLTDCAYTNQDARLLFSGDGTGEDRITPVTGTVIFNEKLYNRTYTVDLGRSHFGYMGTDQGLADLQHSEILVVTLPDMPHVRMKLFSDLQEMGLVEDPNRTIVLIRGGQAGQPVLSQMIRDNPNWNARVVLVEDAPYGTRFAKNRIITGKRKDNVEISVLAPNGAFAQGLEHMRSLFPMGEQIGKSSWPEFEVIPGRAMPFKFGYAIHPRVAFDLTNLRMTVNGKTYLHYNEGIHPALGEVLGELDNERVQLADAYGVRAETFPQKLNRQFKLKLIPGESFYRTMQRTLKTPGDPDSRDIYLSTSHESMQELMDSRYPLEDVPGLFTMNWFANRAGIVLPGHVEYESYIRDILRLVGMSDDTLNNKAGAYLPRLNQMRGGVTEITSLLDDPYNREPPPEGGRETVTLSGPPGPQGPGGGTTPSGGDPTPPTSSGSSVPPSTAGGSAPPNVTLTAYHPTTHLEPTVALVGGGNVGHTLLTDLTDAGQQARLLFRGDGSGRDRITPATGTVTFNEQLRGGTHTVQLGAEHFGYMDTPEGQATLQQAKIIVITMPDAPQSRLQLFRQLQENGLVQDPNKTIVLIRAGQAGQPVLSQMIRDNPDWHASVVLVEDSPYGTRYKQTPNGNIITGKRKDDVEISVLGPDGNVVPGLTDMRSMFPLGEQIGQPSWPNFTVIDGSAMPFKFGYVIHPRVAFDLRNLRMTVNGKTYLHYNEGVYPELGEVLGQLDHERVQLAAAYGVQAETFPQKLNRQFDLPLIPGESFHGTMVRTLKTDDPNSRQIYVSTSHGSIPDLLGSRYPQEDVPGLFTMNWLANRAGLVLPGHAEYESYIRDILGLLGMSPEEMSTNLEGYLPLMDQIQGGIPEIKNLLDTPHDRPPPAGPETITVRGPSGPTGPGDGTTPSGGNPTPGGGSDSGADGNAVPTPPAPSGTSSGALPNATLAGYYSTTHSQPSVVLLGGGNVGHTLLTDLTATGQEGRLLFRGDGSGTDRITPSTGTVTFNEQLRGATHTVQLGPEHFGYMDTPEGLAAMQGAKILVATIPDMPQSRLELFRQWQENGLVQDPNKTIVLIRAGQAGQPALSQIIRDNPDWNASVVLVEDSPYGTRYAQTPDGNIITGKRKDDVEISVLGPDGNVVPGLTDMRSMFPMGDEIGKPSWPDFTVIDGSAMPFKFGYAIHPRVAFDLQNLRMTVNGETYYHYNQGIHPAVGEVLGALDQERVHLADAYGVQAETFPQKLNRQFGLPLIPGESFYDTMQRTVKTDDPNSRQIYVSRSYGSVDALLHSRYPQEDVPGLFTMNWLANRAGLSLPAHAEYESYVRARLSELGMPDEEVHTNLEGYLPLLDQIQGGVPEIKGLLDTPHDRPPPGGRETITLQGPPGPTGPGGGTTPSGGSDSGPDGNAVSIPPMPSSSGGSPPNATSTGFFLTRSDPSPGPQVDVRQGDIRGVMSALLPNEHLPIVARFGGGRDWVRGQGLRRSLRQAGYSADVVTQVSQSLGDLTRPVGRTTVSDIKGLSADDHSRIQALLGELPEGYSGGYGANLLVHLAGLSSGERAEVLTNAESLTPEQMSSLVALVGDMPTRYDSGTAARLTAAVLRFPGTSNAPDAVMSSLTELGALADRASSGTLTSAELDRQNELIDALASQASDSNLPDPLASFPSSSRRPWLEMVTDGVTTGRPVSDATRGDYSAPAKAIAGRLQTSDPLNLFIQTGAPTVDAAGNIVASAYGPAGTALHLRDVLAAASDKSLDVPINVTIVTDQTSRPSVISSLAAAGIRTSDVNIDTSSSPKRQAALVSQIGPGDIFLSIGHSDRNGGRASLLEAANGRGATTFVIDDGTLGGSPTPDQANYVLTAWNPNIGAQALSGSVLRELGLSELMHAPEQVRAVYQAATATPADLATVAAALKVDDAIRTSDANKVDATTQAAAAKAAASRAAEVLKGGDPATAAAAAAEAANFAKAAITSVKAAVRGTDVFAARVVDALPEAGDTAESKTAATKARATARAATTASAKATTATVAYREAAAAVGIAVKTAADAEAAAGTPDAHAKAALAVTTATTAAKKATRAAKAAATVELAAALRPAAKIKAATTAKTIEAQAQLPSIAILDDDRFVPGAAPSTFSVNAHEGNWHLLVYSLGPKADTAAEASRPPTWLDHYAARSNPIELDRYNTLFERARPPEEGVVDKFALKRFQLSQQSTGEKIRTYGGAASAVAAAGFLYGTAHVGWAPIEDAIAAVTLAGTSIRRVQLVKATLVTRLFQANRAPSYTDAEFAPPKALQVPRLRRSTHSDRLDALLIASQSQDPASLAEAKWRIMKNDRTRFATFTVSAAAAISGVGHAFLSAHGIPLDMEVTADFVIGGALTAAQWAAARKLLTARFFPDGRFYAHPNPKVYDSKPSWVQKVTKNTVGNYFEILSGELALNVVRIDVLAPNAQETSTDSIALDLHAVSDMVRALQRQISARFKAAGASRGATSPAHPPGEGRFSAWVELVASSGAGAGIELGDTYDTIHQGIDLLGQGGSGAE